MLKCWRHWQADRPEGLWLLRKPVFLTCGTKRWLYCRSCRCKKGGRRDVRQSAHEQNFLFVRLTILFEPLLVHGLFFPLLGKETQRRLCEAFAFNGRIFARTVKNVRVSDKHVQHCFRNLSASSQPRRREVKSSYRLNERSVSSCLCEEGTK